MKKRWAGYLIWLAAVSCLYFFENSTGTRIMLLCTLLVPLFPSLRQLFLTSDRDRTTAGRKSEWPDPVTDSHPEPGDIRQFCPGDPVNRIHWKLSAKAGRLLLRDTEQVSDTREADAPVRITDDVPADAGKKGAVRTVRRAVLVVLTISLILLIMLPQARSGTATLLNRLFEMSEQKNAYLYNRFPVSSQADIGLTAVLLGICALGLMILCLISPGRLLALLITSCLAFGQSYFGLPFPDWINVLIMLLFVLCTVRRPWSGPDFRKLLALSVTAGIAVCLLIPGTDAATEAASERARDWLGQAAGQAQAAGSESPEGVTEVRHAHSRTLASGTKQADSLDEYRLVTLAEERISMPEWMDLMKTALLLLLTGALVSLPFLPFLWLNRAHRKALQKREAFQSEDVNLAIRAIFQQTIQWLEATGHGAGNYLYRDWPERLSPGLPEGYQDRFRVCAALFEKAAYSPHPLSEDQRLCALALLGETESWCLRQAGWKQKLHLRYREYLLT